MKKLDLASAISFVDSDRKKLFISLYAKCYSPKEFQQVANYQMQYLLKRETVREALNLLKQKLNSKNFKIFNMLYCQKSNYDEVCKSLNISVRTLQRSKKYIQKRFNKILTNMSETRGEYYD